MATSDSSPSKPCGLSNHAPAHRPQGSDDKGPGQIWVQLSSGIGASVMTALATNPFDVVKTRMQVSGSHISTPVRCMLPGRMTVDSSVLRACCILHPESGLLCVGAGGVSASAMRLAASDNVVVQRANAYRTMANIARAEGILALWKGTGSNIVTCIPSVGIYLTTYEQLKAWITHLGVCPQKLSPLLAGGLARAVSVVGTAPLDLMRTRVMAQTGSHSAQLGGAGVLVRALATGGWRSLWRGTAPTLYRDVPFSALYWMLAEAVRERLCATWSMKRDALSVNLVAGFLSGALASLITHPFDVIKTRAQVAESPALVMRGEPAQSTLAALKRLLASEGWAGMWGGIGPRVLKVGPSCAIVLSSYELFKSFMLV